METFKLRHNNKILPDIQSCVMALGFFDGIHIGHQHVIEKAKKIAIKQNLKFAIMTFFPHPKEILRDEKVNYISPLDTKIELFNKLGVDYLFVINFDHLFAKISPQEFINQYVIKLKSKHIVAGFDFTYGHMGRGNMKTIEKDGKGYFKVTTISKVSVSGEKISSTLIRKKLNEGKVNEVSSFLGSHYETVVKINPSQMNNKMLDASISACQIIPAVGLYEIEVSDKERTTLEIAEVYLNREGNQSIKVMIRNKDFLKVEKCLKIKWINRIHNVKPLVTKNGH